MERSCPIKSGFTLKGEMQCDSVQTHQVGLLDLFFPVAIRCGIFSVRIIEYAGIILDAGILGVI